MAFTTNPVPNPQAVVCGSTYRFTILTDRLVRYEWAFDGCFEDRASTFAINRCFPTPQFRVVDNDDNLEIITDHFHLCYDKKRFSPAGLNVHFNFKHTNWGAPWQYGLDEKFQLGGSLNLGGTARTLDLCDGRCDMGEGVISKAGYAALDDSKSMLFDGDFVAGRKPGDRIDGYLFCYGHDYKAAIKAFYSISGHQPILPRYALGNWWSRYYAYHQDEYVQLMDDFRAHNIPISVSVVDMDWHLVSDPCVPHAGWTGYTWNKHLFPNPEKFRSDLHKRRLKITLNDHPHNGVHSHEDVYEEMAKALGYNIQEKNPILFDPSNPKFMKVYLEMHHTLEKTACDFWWIDWQQGPYSKVSGLDPLWLLNHFHYIDHGRDENVTPLIFSRYAGPGSQRYPVGFSGDTVVTWDSLAFQPEFTATASNIGYGWWSHDIGGHIFGSRDDELVTRWVQLGVFSPIFRLHSSDSKWNSKEPWMYRSEYEKVMSNFMTLRHRLVPFLYTCNVIGSIEGEPLVQPMYWWYPDAEPAYACPNQYIFGSQLLVAPIVEPRNKTTNLGAVKAWLPPGPRFVDIFTGQLYDADREITFYRGLEEYPVLAREGTIIPMDASQVPENGCLNVDELEFLVVIGNDAEAIVLEDTRDDAPDATGDKGQRKFVAHFKQAEGKLTVEPMQRASKFRFLSLKSVPNDLKVFCDGIDRTKEVKVTVEEACHAPGLVIECSFSEIGQCIVIELGSDPQIGVVNPTSHLERLLLDYQCAFEMKDQLWKVVTDHMKPFNAVTSTLLSLGYDDPIVGPVLELLLADSRLYSPSGMRTTTNK
ncbi:glycosyl hydrolases family 31-domain-containing protein [Aspergillus pseudotamarii]|uniref:alpha-glucosidase n=1 Tax=Aspergillus pseudotamarii TaxID=132259 RepID=A0A5N6T5Z6_ASPPS|nr:glycosyl hydrolases family 31-domain-containing protein [Aspergillus pseudotamarii]KAE8141725.1 glycosyl hydrolases family 31-domain-containing protein [Aspergillus pseudotamarii]